MSNPAFTFDHIHWSPIMEGHCLQTMPIPYYQSKMVHLSVVRPTIHCGEHEVYPS